MLLCEFRDFIEYADGLYGKLEYLEEQGETNVRMHELYKEFKKIMLKEAVTDNIKNLRDFIDMYASEIEPYYDKHLSMILLREEG